MSALLYVFITSLPAHIIVFFQYWDFSWRSKKLALVLACVNMALKLWAVHWALESGFGVRFIEVLFSLFGSLIYFFLIRKAFFKLLFTYTLMLDYLIVVRGAASFLSIRIFGADSQSWQSALLCALLYLLSMPWLLRSFRKAARQVFRIHAPRLWGTIWLVPALTSVVVLFYTNAFEEENVGSWSSLLTRLVLLACILAVYSTLLHSLEELRSRAALEEQAKQAEQILNLQRAQYDQLRSYLEEIRRARHDLRQHQNIIRSYLESGDEGPLRDYLQAQSSSLPMENIRQYCRNYTVNMLLNYYASRFSDAQIDFEFQVELPERLTVSEPDLCVVLGNLLENAQEACAGQEEPYIRAAARLTGSRAITFIVDNTASVPPTTQPDGTFRSTKHTGAGLGTQSIRYIARQYGGTADFHWKNGMFLASVFLNPPKERAHPDSARTSEIT